MASIRERAMAWERNGEVGRARFRLIRGAIRHVQTAQAAGFHLEAIAVLESLLGDRIESAVSESERSNIGFRTLESLIRTARGSSELDSSLKRIIEGPIADWKNARNKALHEMVKLEAARMHSWESRYAEQAGHVDEGLRLFRELSNQLRRVRRHKPTSASGD